MSFFLSILIGPSGDSPDREWDLARIKASTLVLACPGKAVLAHEILNGKGIVIGEAELPERKLDIGLLSMMRIEADCYEQNVLATGCRLLKEENVVVPRVEKRDP